jgi:hypothetical protein
MKIIEVCKRDVVVVNRGVLLPEAAGIMRERFVEDWVRR